jgi:hypothetical protein
MKRRARLQQLPEPKAANPRRQREREVHTTVVDHLFKRGAPGIFFFHPSNGSYYGANRTGAVVHGRRMKLCQVSGMPDLMICRANHPLYALELKADRGRLSKAQRECHAALVAAGVIVGTAVGIDQALQWLESHKLLRGRAQ